MWARQDLLAELKRLGLLRSPELERSFLRVNQETFLPDLLGSLAYADMPLPIRTSPDTPTMPSARCLIAALDLLEATRDQRVLVAGCRGGYSVALLADIVGADHLVAIESDEERRTRTIERLRSAGFGDVRVLPTAPDERFDRILVMDATPPKQLVALLADPGSLIARGRGVHDLAFVKIVRSAGETMQMTFNEAPSGVIAGPRNADEVARVDFGRLFAVEDLLVHAWEGRVTGHYDQHFRDVMDDTFAGGPLGPDAFDPKKDPRKDAARRAFHAAYILQSAGELDRVRLGARMARTNLEASVDRMGAEPGTTAVQINQVNALLASSHRFVHAVMALEAGWLHTAAVPARTAFRTFAADVEKTLDLLAAALRGTRVQMKEFPDLREDHHVLLQSGDQKIERYALVNVEADRIVNSLNTLREQVMEHVHPKTAA